MTELIGKNLRCFKANLHCHSTISDGFVNLPKKAGLGVEVNRELIIEENKTPHNWKNPVWHHADGSVAEW